jgi:phosphate starvation-inducible protein PhoH
MKRSDVKREVSKMTERNKRRNSKKKKNRTECVERDNSKEPQYSEGKHKVAPPVVAKNDFQKELLNALKTRQVIICNAPAGVGKSHCAMFVVAWVEEFIEDHNLHEYAAVVKATSDDIVRSGFCKAVVKAKESQVDAKGDFHEEY